MARALLDLGCSQHLNNPDCQPTAPALGSRSRPQVAPVSRGCHYKGPQTVWLKPQTQLSPRAGGGKSEMEVGQVGPAGAARKAPLQALSLGVDGWLLWACLCPDFPFL